MISLGIHPTEISSCSARVELSSTGRLVSTTKVLSVAPSYDKTPAQMTCIARYGASSNLTPRLVKRNPKPKQAVPNDGDSTTVTLKWGKKTYADEQLSIIPGQSTVLYLKVQVNSLTGIPVARQKLLCPKAWKGTLQKDDNDVVLPHDFGVSGKGGNKGVIVVTLIGSAETIDELRPPIITDNNTSNHYKKGMRVNYITENGDVQQICTILAMDLDDVLEPYYTVRMEDGREKEAAF